MKKLKETPSTNWKISYLPITVGVSEKRLRGRIFDEKRSNTTPTLV
ncbi:hypothetical protein T03_16140 [Trichinella britovi]|uniref:Uncharacterized protein n=1 Tax=Trichinella britovi TaxID=45882 RepID=A0A0V1AST1_TRIBR|nr:hypothetical protein T03_14215 [Trichinella britovi]KRY27813.1 hypothetical protein T03_16140 [Trichinella britovi]